MFDFNINNPNEFVPESSLPKGTIGKGGLSAMNDAARGSPQAPKLLGGLQGEFTQADLEARLVPRIRSMENIDGARAARRKRLEELQSSLTAPDDDFTGIDYIVRGMMQNEDPSNVGTGFRKGVAAAMDARLARGKSKKAGNIAAAQVGYKHEADEGTNDEQMESSAISNLRMLAKPLVARGSGSGAGAGGNPFKWVPGTGYVNINDLDGEGKPRVVFGDPRIAAQVRLTARKSAEKEVESNLHKITFKTAEEREEYIEKRADDIANEVLGGAAGTTPPGAPQTPAQRPSSTTGGPAAAPAKPAGGMPDWRNPAGEQGRLDVLEEEHNDIQRRLTAEKDPKRQEALRADLAAIQREMANVSKGAAKTPTYALETPDVQAGKTKTAEKLAESHVEYATKLRNDAEVGLKVVSTVNELRQLKFDPGFFAKWKQRGGNILEAFGSEGPLARAAAQSGNAEALLQGLSNARISLEKGVQTRDDELRFKREIAQITDPKEGYRYMLKYMEELARKNIDQHNTVDNYKRANGSYDGADRAWQQRNEQYGGLVKRYQNTFVGRTEFINAIINQPENKKKYAGKEDELRQKAESAWATLGGGK